MKKVLSILILESVILASASGTVSDDIRELKNRVQALEDNKVSACRLVDRRNGTHFNQCPEGSFAKSAMVINDSTIQMDCGYYEIQCEKENED